MSMDEFAREFVARIREASDDEELSHLVSEIYEAGLEDGYNEKDGIAQGFE